MPSLSLFSSSSAQAEPRSEKLSMAARLSNSRRLRRKNTAPAAPPTHSTGSFSTSSYSAASSATSLGIHRPPSSGVTGWLHRSSTSKTSKSTRSVGTTGRRNTDEHGMLRAREAPVPIPVRQKTPINYERRSTTTKQIGGSIRGLNIGHPVGPSTPPRPIASKPTATPTRFPASAPSHMPPVPPIPQMYIPPRASLIDASRPDGYNGSGKGNDTFDAITARIGYHDSLPKPQKRHSISNFLKEQSPVPQPVVTRNYRVPLDAEFEPQQLYQRPQTTHDTKRVLDPSGVWKSGPAAPPFSRRNSEVNTSNVSLLSPELLSNDFPAKPRPARRVTDPVIPMAPPEPPRSTSPVRRTLTEPAYPLDEDEDAEGQAAAFHAVTANQAIPSGPPSTNFDGIIEKLPEDAPARQPEAETAPASTVPPAAIGHTKPHSDRSNSFMGGWKLGIVRQNTQKSQRSQKSQKSSDSEKSSGASTLSMKSGEESRDSRSWIQRKKGSFSSSASSFIDKEKKQTAPEKPVSASKAYRQAQNTFLASKAPTNVGKARPTTAVDTSTRPDEKLPKVNSGFKKESANQPVDDEKKEPIAANVPCQLTQQNLERESARLMAKLQDVEASLSSEDPHDADSFPRPRALSASSPLPTPPAEDDLASTGPVGLGAAVQQLALLEEKLANEGRPISPPDSRDGASNRTSSETTDDELFEDAKDVVTPLTAPKPIGSRSPIPISPSSSGTSTPTSSYSAGRRHSLPRPAPPPGHRAHKKDKSVSPLRNEVNSTDSHTSYFPAQAAKTTNIRRSELRGLERHSIATSLPASPKQRGSSGVPPTPPKPIAKLFVICCRCKYWHDLPSAMYRGMVENGGATRCPYCLHGMETSCCSGYTCVVYMHQKHH